MSVQQPVFPAYGTGLLLSTSAVAAASTALPAATKQLVLTAKTTDAYVRITDLSDTSSATTADFLVPVGTPRTISKGAQTRISHIAPGGAGTLHVIGADGSTAM